MDPDFRKQLRQVTRKVRGQMYEQLNEEVDILEDENEALQELIEEERNEAFKELCQSKAEYRALNKEAEQMLLEAAEERSKEIYAHNRSIKKIIKLQEELKKRYENEFRDFLQTAQQKEDKIKDELKSVLNELERKLPDEEFAIVLKYVERENRARENKRQVAIEKLKMSDNMKEILNDHIELQEKIEIERQKIRDVYQEVYESLNISFNSQISLYERKDGDGGMSLDNENAQPLTDSQKLNYNLAPFETDYSELTSREHKLVAVETFPKAKLSTIIEASHEESDSQQSLAVEMPPPKESTKQSRASGFLPSVQVESQKEAAPSSGATNNCNKENDLNAFNFENFNTTENGNEFNFNFNQSASGNDAGDAFNFNFDEPQAGSGKPADGENFEFNFDQTQNNDNNGGDDDGFVFNFDGQNNEKEQSFHFNFDE